MNRLNEFARLRVDQKGLTLVELLVVIVLISLIAVVVGQNVIGKGDAAKAELNYVKMEKLKNTLGQYRLMYHSYPSKLDDLITGSAEARKGGRPFIALAEESDLRDVWNFPFIYTQENEGRSFTLRSLGSDGVEGGEGAKQDVTIKP